MAHAQFQFSLELEFDFRGLLRDSADDSPDVAIYRRAFVMKTTSQPRPDTLKTDRVYDLRNYSSIKPPSSTGTTCLPGREGRLRQYPASGLRFRKSSSLRAHRLDRELVALFFPQVTNRADEYTSGKEKFLLRSYQPRTIPTEIGPIRL